MENLLKCPNCGHEMADDAKAICLELLENKEFIKRVLNSDNLSDEAKKELGKIKSLMNRIDALYK